jgi:hypothetical protein
MQTSHSLGKSLFGLIRELPDAAIGFIEKEIELAKIEITEKISDAANDAVSAIAGGFVALAGVLLLLGALGFLASKGYTQLGLDPFFALAAGFASVGFVVTVVGSAFVFKGAKDLSNQSATPEKAVDTLKTDTDDAGEKHAAMRTHATEPIDYAESQALGRKSDLGETLEEIRERVQPQNIKKQVVQRLRAKPYHWALGTMLLSTLGGFLIRHHLRRHST